MGLVRFCDCVCERVPSMPLRTVLEWQCDRQRPTLAPPRQPSHPDAADPELRPGQRRRAPHRFPGGGLALPRCLPVTGPLGCAQGPSPTVDPSGFPKYEHQAAFRGFQVGIFFSGSAADL